MFYKNSKKTYTAFLSLFIAITMLLLSYAAVPLYKMFCQITGFAGTPRIYAEQSKQSSNKSLTIHFDTNTSKDLLWNFTPEKAKILVNIGEMKTVFFNVKNKSNTKVTGMASYNVSPPQAGIYFAKVSCFCFSEQTLEPGESIDFPLVFYIDTESEKDLDMLNVKSITLSYTFYPL